MTKLSALFDYFRQRPNPAFPPMNELDVALSARDWLADMPEQEPRNYRAIGAFTFRHLPLDYCRPSLFSKKARAKAALVNFTARHNSELCC